MEQHALLASCAVVDLGIARITYRFKPRESVIGEIQHGVRDDGSLTLDDYHWELTGGGKRDPAKISWRQQIGSGLRFERLQAYMVEYLEADRQARELLRQSQQSPLGRVVQAAGIPPSEQLELVTILQEANCEIAESPSIETIGSSLQEMFRSTAGEAEETTVRLGMTDASFSSIARGLTLLLSNSQLSDFSPLRNGLGVNNLLYISLLLELFERRRKATTAAGHLMLVEEPEAHLHPQLQRVLYESLGSDKETVQVILSTHSTHVSGSADLGSCLLLTKTSDRGTAAFVPDTVLKTEERRDLERFLDATRSTLLYARKVLLVEGLSEVYLIPPLVKRTMGIDLERHGIAVVAIHGTHFASYAKLFGADALPKKCAIIGDFDLDPGDADPYEEGDPDTDDEDDVFISEDLQGIECDYVRVYQCLTTFERVITRPGSLSMFSSAAAHLGASKIAADLEALAELVATGEELPEEDLLTARRQVLSTAKRFGKARFAQVSARFVDNVDVETGLAEYIRQAITWLTAKESDEADTGAV